MSHGRESQGKNHEDGGVASISSRKRHHHHYDCLFKSEKSSLHEGDKRDRVKE